MTDWQPTDPTAVEPVAEPVSSLTPENLNEGFALEALAADPKSAYWRGDDKHSAPEYQDRYLGLIRGELSGAPDEVAAPDAGPDLDLPIAADQYRLDALPIYDAPTRDIVDSFLPAAYESGIGAQKTRAVLDWALNTETPTPASFRAWASKQGWPERHIKAALDWHTKQQEKVK